MKARVMLDRVLCTARLQMDTAICPGTLWAPFCKQRRRKHTVANVITIDLKAQACRVILCAFHSFQSWP